MIMHTEALPRVGVVGGSGYAGQEILTILAGHGGVEVGFATSRSRAGRSTPLEGVSYESPDEVDAGAVDLVFLAVPHGQGEPWVRRIGDHGPRIVDLTADHRPGSGREAGAVYGLFECASDMLAAARVVANPGCYPTGILLALLPLREDGLLATDGTVVVNAASGVTGAGRTPKAELLFAEVSGDFRPYALGNEHRHLLEIRAALPDVEVLFTPHLLPVARGILETMTVPVRSGIGAAQIRESWTEAYGSSRVVRLEPSERVPGLSGVAGSDRLHLWAGDNRGAGAPTVTVIAALDNLGKGAAGQAVQNMNRMLGQPDDRGLRC